MNIIFDPISLHWSKKFLSITINHRWTGCHTYTHNSFVANHLWWQFKYKLTKWLYWIETVIRKRSKGSSTFKCFSHIHYSLNNNNGSECWTTLPYLLISISQLLMSYLKSIQWATAEQSVHQTNPTFFQPWWWFKYRNVCDYIIPDSIIPNWNETEKRKPLTKYQSMHRSM